MKNLIIILTFALILILPTAVQAQNYDWAISSSGKLVDEGTAVCLDASGNSYIAGSFTSRPFGIGEFSFMNTAKPPNQQTADMFVAKLDQTGKVLWAIRSEGIGEEKARAISCDRTGHIVVAGLFKGQKATFGTVEITNPKRNSISIFMLKVNALGKINWVKNEAQKSIKPSVNSVSTGPDGEIYMTGHFSNRGTFGGYPYKSKNGNNPAAFVAKYLANGEIKWLHQIYGTSGGGQKSQQSGEAIFATNDSRFVYVAGWFSGHVRFGEGKVLTSNNFRNKKGIPYQRNFFVTKYHADDAREIWTTPIGVTQVNLSTSPVIKGIVVDNEGSSFITGHFPGTLIFGKDNLATTPSRSSKSYNFDIFLAKLDQNGKYLWHRNAGGNEDDRSNAIALTEKGVMITGSVSRNVKFGNNVSLLSGRINSMFMAEYDTNGNALWAKGDKGKNLTGINQGLAIANNGKNAVVVGTYLGNQIGFGNIKLKETGSLNLFVAKNKK
jgi:hypothetical protein